MIKKCNYIEQINNVYCNAIKIRHNDEQKQNIIVMLFPLVIQTYQNIT